MQVFLFSVSLQVVYFLVRTLVFPSLSLFFFLFYFVAGFVGFIPIVVVVFMIFFIFLCVLSFANSLMPSCFGALD